MSQKSSIIKLNDFVIKCGYPLCPFYSEEVTEMDCPMPIEGAACQGLGDPEEYIDHPVECRCETCRFWS